MGHQSWFAICKNDTDNIFKSKKVDLTISGFYNSVYHPAEWTPRYNAYGEIIYKENAFGYPDANAEMCSAIETDSGYALQVFMKVSDDLTNTDSLFLKLTNYVNFYAADIYLKNLPQIDSLDNITYIGLPH
jgi:hypothetical protein